jgi:hypothetical protein
MGFRLGAILFSLILIGESFLASSSTRHNDTDSWVRSRIDALVIAARAAFENDDDLPPYQKLLKSIVRTIRVRALLRDEKFTNRYRNFLDYVQEASFDQLPGHELGFSSSDRQYFAETKQYTEIPDFLLNQRFLHAVSRSETLEKAKDFLRQINLSKDPAERLLFFSYTSRHLGTPDNDDSLKRLLIVVPGDSGKGIPEKWVQFGVTDPKAKVRIRNVSVVASVPDDKGTFDTYFKDFFRIYRRNGSIGLRGRWELGEGDDNCVRCHKSGVLPIFPEEGSVSPQEESTVAEVNKRFLSYGTPRFGRYLNDNKFGPGLGSATARQRNLRFGDGFDQTPVGRAMNCAECHQREQLGALNWPVDPVVINSYIKEGKMPFGSPTDASVRREIREKLIEEYFATDDSMPGILKSWLLGKTEQYSSSN